MKSIINPVASAAYIAVVLAAAMANNQSALSQIDISYALQQRLITSQLVWDDRRQRTIVTYRIMEKGRDWLREHKASNPS